MYILIFLLISFSIKLLDNELKIENKKFKLTLKDSNEKEIKFEEFIKNLKESNFIKDNLEFESFLNNEIIKIKEIKNEEEKKEKDEPNLNKEEEEEDAFDWE